MKKSILILVCFLVLLIQPAIATNWYAAGLNGLSLNPTNDNSFFACNGTQVTEFSVTGVIGSEGVHGYTANLADVFVTDDDFYALRVDGLIYRTPRNGTNIDFPSSLDGDVTVYLGDAFAGTNSRARIVVDDDLDIFVSINTGGQTLPQLTYPDYSLIDYLTITELPTYYINSISAGSDGLLTVPSNDITGSNVVVGKASFRSIDYDAAVSYPADTSGPTIQGVAELSNGEYVVAWRPSSTNVVVDQVYSNGSLRARIVDFGYFGSLEMGDIIVLPGGTGVYSDDINDFAHTFTTLDNVGGYSAFQSHSTGAVNQNATITWTDDTYTTSDTANITFSVVNPDYDAYDYTVKVHDTVSLKQTYEIDAVENNSVLYSFSPSATSSTYLAQLIAIDSTTGETDVLAMDTTSFTASDDTYSIEFDDSTYRVGDTMKIYYSDLPAGSSIYLRGTDSSSTTVYSKTWSVSGTSYVSLTIPNNTVESYTAYALHDGYILDYDVSEVIQSESEITVYGVVYDAQSGATIENAHILINGTGPLSNEVGRYSTIIEAGSYPLVVSASGYNTQSYSSVSFMVDTNRNFYMSPVSSSSTSSTASLYGAVRNYETGAALEGAMLTVANSTGFTKTTFTSSTGFYDISGLLNNSSYSVYSSLDGYDSYYNASITVTGTTWLEFSLVDEDYSLGTGSGDSTGTTTDRPGRAGAEETLANLEEVVPGLIMFVVFFVFMNVARKG